MVSIYDKNPQLLVAKASDELKKKMSAPSWSLYVKTGVSRDRVPENPDWWYVRAASIMRRIHLNGPVGVERLRTYYGGLHRRGHKPAHFARGGGKIVRVILQDLEKAGFVQKVDKPKKGRILTADGKRFLNAVAKSVA
ncbi:MAG: 30S ribosomal protein S19e [Candidatus Aenigmarchaeota archaeon]|nr:30S ribosomal protein S19e [Candidatus Aenigmarchaeota archaeon]